jgi:hypothetical protein
MWGRRLHKVLKVNQTPFSLRFASEGRGFVLQEAVAFLFQGGNWFNMTVQNKNT